VAPADTAQAAWVPSLILQPLVENAVVHGLAAHDGPVSIDVHVSVADETLILRVSNTVARREPLGREGIGLRNVRERLAIQFGTQASFSAGVGSEGVWVATIRLPLLHDAPIPPSS
jgi:LytS/YehU family sensor histidine kinase